MSTISLVDPVARDLARAFAAFDPVRQPLAEYRAALDAALGGGGRSEGLRYEERRIPRGGGEQDVRVLVYRPHERRGRLPVILFLHASGFIAGRPEASAQANQTLADEHGALVVAVAYRLAPETPFPGAVEDCYTALAWLKRNADQLDVDSNRIVVMGESAGGGLAAALALLVRDRGEMTIIGQLLVYPMLDPRTGTDQAPSDNPFTGEFVWTRGHNRFGWDALRGRREVPIERIGHFAPALATDLTGLPPAFIAVGALDLFVEEDAAYALRLCRAGVPVELHIYPGGVHGFDYADGKIAAQFRADRHAALSRWIES